MAKRKRKRKGLGEVTKKDFVSIASILKFNTVPCKLVEDFASYFASQNSRFSPERFIAATGRCKPGGLGRGESGQKATCLHRLPNGRCIEWAVNGHNVKVR